MFTDIPLTRPHTPLLNKIQKPEDLRLLPSDKLTELARELRLFLLYLVGQTGGHFGAGLGVIELTVALHYVFNTPFDRVVWDVGHQAYPHKILTGRREQLFTLRQQEGIKGFPCREESEFDTFGVGHSSTSISAALGMALANKLAGIKRKCVAVIGDGAMTAGMAFEALNHAGHEKANLLVILNDNRMSISENVGGLSNYFARILASRTYHSLREGSKKILEGSPNALSFAKKTEEHFKGMVCPGTLFEEMGFNYIGPIHGHDIDQLIESLEKIKNRPGPQLLHIVTQKGKGFLPAEEDPIAYHALSKIEPKKKSTTTEQLKPKYSDIFGQWLCDMAEIDGKLVGITPAMREGSGMVDFSKRYPDRYYDVAIAEQHSVTFAAGLACEGYKPVVAIYSTFLQRAYDQLIHDVAIQNLDVLFAIDRAGLVGEDGPTHAGSFDLTYLRCIPNIIIMAPSDENECRQMLYTGFKYAGPAAVRYPRGTGTGVQIETKMSAIPLGKAIIKREGARVAFLSFGSTLSATLKAAEVLNATVADMRFIKPLDEKMIVQLRKDYELLVTVEENTVAGGAGSAVSEFLNEKGLNASLLQIGLPDRFVNHGTHAQMLKACHLDAEGILEKTNSRLNS